MLDVSLEIHLSFLNYLNHERILAKSWLYPLSSSLSSPDPCRQWAFTERQPSAGNRDLRACPASALTPEEPENRRAGSVAWPLRTAVSPSCPPCHVQSHQNKGDTVVTSQLRMGE